MHDALETSRGGAGAVLRRRGRRGYLLIAAMAILMVMFTLAMALNYMSGSARSAYMMSEAQFQAEQAVFSQQAVKGTTLASQSPAPASVGVEILASEGSQGLDGIAPPKYGSEIFGRIGNKAAGFDRSVAYQASTKALGDYPAAPWHSYVGFLPKTSRIDLRIFGARRYVSVFSANFPYAVCAPQGSITLEGAVAWANPPFGAKYADPVKSVTGVPVRLVARENVTVNASFPYGEIYSEKGSIKVPAGSGAVGLYGALPLNPPTSGGMDSRDYATRVVAMADEVVSQVVLSAQNGNKTAVLTGTWDLGQVIKLFTNPGGFLASVRNALSVRMAMKFPMPIIPGFALAPPYYRFIFHMPFAPDLSQAGSKTDGSGIPNIDAKAQIDKINDVKKQIEDLKDKINSATGDLLSDLTDQLNKLQSLLDSLVAGLQNSVANAKTFLDGLKPGSDDGPATRRAEADSGLGEDGDKGYAYKPLMDALWGLISGMVDIVSGGNGLQTFMEKVTHDVRLVYFGREDTVARFNIQEGSMDLVATLTVPRGRTLRLDTSVKLQGDLWVQRGGALYVNGKLDVVSPTQPPPDDPFAPAGRVFLEEGATIVVANSFSCQGSARWGSVLVTGPPGNVRPITSAIVASGNVTIPYGVHPALGFDEVVSAAGGSSLIADALNGLAPNVAKFAGPFHRRKPYLASWATVIGVVTPVPFVGVIIFPEPSQITNIHVPIFRAMSMLYATSLNMTLGENLFTHCDWWIFGEGVVPIMPRMDPSGIKTALTSLGGQFPAITGTVASLVTNAFNQVVSELLTTILKKVLEEVVGQALQAVPYAGLVSAALSSALDSVKAMIMDKITNLENNALSAVGGLTSTQAHSIEAGIVAELKTAVRDAINAGMQAAMLHEVPGALVFARGNLSVGNEADTLIAVGMFAADGDVKVGAQTVVGSLLSRKGSITAKQVLFFPCFTRASVSIPKEQPFDGDWFKKAVDVTGYGGGMYRNDQGPASVDVGFPMQHVTAGGWDQ